MKYTSHTRRALLANASRSFAASWLSVRLSLLTSLASASLRESARDIDALSHLTTGEARTMGDFAACIIPSEDNTSGADNDGVVYFTDRALGSGFFADAVPVIRGGLADLDLRANRAGARNGFSSLSTSRQHAVLRDIEHSAFFAIARSLVIVGAFADPSYDELRHGSGWRMLAVEHGTTYAPPFGWYDSSLHPDAA